MKLLRQVNFDGETIDLATAAQLLGIGDDDIDAEYGVVGVDPSQGIYAVLVEVADGESHEGTFANPRIVTWGAVQD